MSISEKEAKYNVLAASESEKHREYLECEYIETLQKVFHKHESVRQQPFGQYRVDLYFPSSKLCIECDEAHHQGKEEADCARQAYIERTFGVTFVRFKTSDETFDLSQVVVEIRRLLK